MLAPRTATVTIVDDDTPLPNYSSFAGATGLTLNGNAAIAGSVLRVTPAVPLQKGSAFFSSPIPFSQTSSFATEFQFRITGGPGGADGFAFVLQNSPLAANALGEVGAALGYAPSITNSLIVEFDTFQNIGEVNANHVAVSLNGSSLSPIRLQGAPFDIKDGNVAHAWIDYNASSRVLAIYLSQSATKPQEPLFFLEIDVAGLVGSRLFTGFTAGTGGGSSNHDILSWSYSTTPPVVPLPTGPIPIDVTVANGLEEPTAIEWIDNNNNLLIAQKNGVVRVVRDGNMLTTPFIDLSAQVNNGSDRGLLGLAVHPDFAVTPYVYLLYAYDPPEVMGNTGLAGPDGNGNRAGRLMRVTADAATNYTTVVPGSEVIILGTNSVWSNFNGFVNSTIDFNEPPAGILPDGSSLRDFIAIDSQSHAPGSVRFGIDGALYVTVGDGTSYNQVDPRSVRVQDIDNLSGKLLRIDPITGNGLPDNPFFNGDPLSNRSKVYQLGLRNPFRMEIDPVTGQIYIGDVGWSTWEEINTGGPGANFGWPYYEGGNGVSSQQTGGYQDLPEAQAFYASGTPVVPSLVALNHAIDGINAIIMGTVYRGSLYPSSYQGDVFFNDFGQGIVRHLSYDEFGNPVGLEIFATGAQIVVQIKEGPDGSLYFVDLDDGRVGRWIFAEPSPESLEASPSGSDIIEESSEIDEASILSESLPPVDFDRRDVSQDGFVSPLDALLLINALKRDPAGVMSTSPWYDVNEDGVLSPLDVLWVINHLSRRSQEPTATGIDDSASLLTGSRMSVDPSTVYDGIGIDEEARRRRIAAVDQVFLSPFSLD